MKFKMLVSDGQGDWWEEYDKPCKDARKCAKEIVEYFNRTLGPCESPRTLKAVEVLDAHSQKDHAWEKQNAFTIKSGGRFYDVYRCKNCGITAKRFGLDVAVIIDSRFLAKVYLRCDTTQAHLAKRR